MKTNPPDPTPSEKPEEPESSDWGETKAIIGGVLTLVTVVMLGLRVYFTFFADRSAEEREYQERMAENVRILEAKREAESPISPRDRKILASVGGMSACRSFLEDIQSGRLTEAYARTSPEYKARVTPAAFEEFARTNGLTTTPLVCRVTAQTTLQGSVTKFDLTEDPKLPAGSPVLTILAEKTTAWVVTDVFWKP